MSSPSQTPRQIYKARLKDGTLEADPQQAKAVDILDVLYDELLVYTGKPKRSWFSKRLPPPKGVYMHGGVGRGKSMIMDMFYDCLPDNIRKRRVHFHEFMIGVHDYIHSRRESDGIREGVDATLPLLAERIAEQSQVLCFDEFHVTDVTDAMILGRLFRGVFDRGVVMVATSNWPPDRLYEGGLQRERFLPFIELVKEKHEIVHLDSPTDYRKQFLANEGSYFTPLSDDVSAKMDDVFAKLTDHVTADQETLSVKGREIIVPQSAKGVARFSFADLCENPLGAEDYRAVADAYHTIILEEMPILKPAKRNEAKRLMTLIDVLYEAGTNIVISADATPDKIYKGKDHAFEFDRTISRLQEMQSAEYLEKSR